MLAVSHFTEPGQGRSRGPELNFGIDKRISEPGASANDAGCRSGGYGGLAGAPFARQNRGVEPRGAD